MFVYAFHRLRKKVKHHVTHVEPVCPEVEDLKAEEINNTKEFIKNIKKALKRKGAELVSGGLILIPTQRVIDLLGVTANSFKKLATAQEDIYTEAYRNKNKQGQYYIEYSKVIFKSVGDRDYAIVYNNATEYTYLDLKEYFFLKDNNFKIVGRDGAGKECMIMDSFNNTMVGFIRCKAHNINLSLVTTEF